MISQVVFWSRTTKNWFRIVFYSIFEPWAPLEKLSFVDFFTFSLVSDFLKSLVFFGFSNVFCSYMMFIFMISQVLFLVTHDEYIDFVLFLCSTFEPWAPLEKLSFVDFFTAAPASMQRTPSFSECDTLCPCWSPAGLQKKSMRQAKDLSMSRTACSTCVFQTGQETLKPY